MQYISADVVVPVLRVLRELGANVSRFRPSATGLGGADADALMDAAAEQLGDAVGIRVATEMPLGALGPVDYALSTSATVRDALHRLARYYGVATERVELEVLEAPAAGLELVRNPAVRHSRHWIEFSVALIAGRLRAAVGRSMRIERVHFLHDAPQSTQVHESYFGAPVAFACRADQLLLPTALLGQPLRTAAPALVEVLESSLREIEETAHGDPLVRRTRKAIADTLGKEDFGIDGVAKKLATSRRSLQRCLSEQGTSFREIVDDIRRHRAQRLLEQRQLSTRQIAAELGFADTGAFFRAFRRWTGNTPRRRSRRG